MVDTEIILWLVPAVLIAVALLAKLTTFRAKPPEYYRGAEPDES